MKPICVANLCPMVLGDHTGISESIPAVNADGVLTLGAAVNADTTAGQAIDIDAKGTTSVQGVSAYRVLSFWLLFSRKPEDAGSASAAQQWIA